MYKRSERRLGTGGVGACRFVQQLVDDLRRRGRYVVMWCGACVKRRSGGYAQRGPSVYGGGVGEMAGQFSAGVCAFQIGCSARILNAQRAQTTRRCLFLNVQISVPVFWPILMM